MLRRYGFVIMGSDDYIQVADHLTPSRKGEAKAEVAPRKVRIILVAGCKTETPR